MVDAALVPTYWHSIVSGHSWRDDGSGSIIVAASVTMWSRKAKNGVLLFAYRFRQNKESGVSYYAPALLVAIKPLLRRRLPRDVVWATPYSFRRGAPLALDDLGAAFEQATR